MRTVIYQLAGMAGTFAAGVLCGMLLRPSTGRLARAHLAVLPATGIGVTRRGWRVRRARPGAARSAFGSGELAADEGWDTYRSDVMADDTGEAG